MFADACMKVTEFTKPVVVSTRLQNGEVRTECGTFIILNREGWAITAGHLFDSLQRFQTDQNKMREIASLNESRRSLPGAPPMEVKPDPEYIVNHSFWWGWDGVRMNNVYVNRQIDIAVGRLEPFNPDWVREYPVLKDPAHLRVGTSVCRMGYAFLGIKSTFSSPAFICAMVSGLVPMWETITLSTCLFTTSLPKDLSGNAVSLQIRVRPRTPFSTYAFMRVRFKVENAVSDAEK